MCSRTGALVDSKTVENLLTKDVEKGIFEKEIFSLCMDEACEMAYFSADYEYLFLQRQVKTPLDFKQDADIRYACYCKRITYDQVKHAVLFEGAKSAKDILRYHGPVKVEECKLENPLGFCCMPDLNKMIDGIRFPK